MEIDEFVSFSKNDNVEAPTACPALCIWQVGMDKDVLDSFVAEPAEDLAHVTAFSARVDPHVAVVPPEIIRASLRHGPAATPKA